MNDLDRLSEAIATYSKRAVHAETRAALLETEVATLTAERPEPPAFVLGEQAAAEARRLIDRGCSAADAVLAVLRDWTRGRTNAEIGAITRAVLTAVAGEGS